MDFAEFVLGEESEGHGGPVNALLFSDDGKLLVSGGDDESVRVWDTETLKCLQVFKDERWGQVTTLTWIVHESRTTRLCIGSGRGLATLCPVVGDYSSESQHPLASERSFILPVFGLLEAVVAVGYDNKNSRLLFASNLGHMHLYSIDQGTGALQELWYKGIDERVATVIPSFTNGVGDLSLLPIYAHSSSFQCLSVPADNEASDPAMSNVASSVQEDVLRSFEPDFPLLFPISQLLSEEIDCTIFNLSKSDTHLETDTGPVKFLDSDHDCGSGNLISYTPSPIFTQTTADFVDAELPITDLINTTASPGISTAADVDDWPVVADLLVMGGTCPLVPVSPPFDLDPELESITLIGLPDFSTCNAMFGLGLDEFTLVDVGLMADLTDTGLSCFDLGWCTTEGGNELADLLQGAAVDM